MDTDWDWDWVVQEGLLEKVTFERDVKGKKGSDMQKSGEKSISNVENSWHAGPK